VRHRSQDAVKGLEDLGLVPFLTRIETAVVHLLGKLGRGYVYGKRSLLLNTREPTRSRERYLKKTYGWVDRRFGPF
jgi:hypothetical protein